jgi:hypothetical protein
VAFPLIAIPTTSSVNIARTLVGPGPGPTGLDRSRRIVTDTDSLDPPATTKPPTSPTGCGSSAKNPRHLRTVAGAAEATADIATAGDVTRQISA